MDEQEPPDFDIAQHLAALQPPNTPDESFDKANEHLYHIKIWKKAHTISILAGLSTEPAFHANGIRIDWLQRLVVSKSEGRRKPRSTELRQALNGGLKQANVLSLEDPSEDLFCELVTTVSGDYRIFTGHWETAAPHTQTLLDAYISLPESSIKRDALTSIFALLRLSDEIAERAGIHRLTPSSGEPKDVISIPNTEKLKQIARRVKFTDSELHRLGVNKSALAPFLLETLHYPYVSSLEPGESPLEFYPLLASPNSIIVASPANISTAIRAIIVSTAQENGMHDYLLTSMLNAQKEFACKSAFWPTQSLELPPPNQHFLRSSICQFAEGRYMQVIQVSATFDQFPARGFSSMRILSEGANQIIENDVSMFWQYLDRQSNCKESVTVFLLSGWGAPLALPTAMSETGAPTHWLKMDITFADAAVLGACENGDFHDIHRMCKQVQHLEGEGFSFQNPNGILNMFGFWRNTDGNLIPEHMFEITPPCQLLLPTDDLLGPRIEAAKKRDVRSLPYPDGSFKVVQRTDWDDEGALQPIYGSFDDATEGKLLGAVHLNGRTWWIESISGPDDNREWRYQIWKATLVWLATVGSETIAQFSQALPEGASRVEIRIPIASDITSIEPSTATSPSLPNTIAGLEGNDGNSRRVQISPGWMGYLGQTENDAEVELIAAVLEQIAYNQHSYIAREHLRACVRGAINSSSWRWLHAQPVVTPLDDLDRSGLLGRFHEISLSTVSLAKCGSVWQFRNRSATHEISGIEECRAFLTEYRNNILEELISRIRKFDREKLIILSAHSYQTARGEQSRWRRTIRALRAIHGVSADTKAITRQYAINAVQRAAKTICEIAACEAPLVGGSAPDDIDLEEMFAKALLLFSNGQLFASIRSGLIQPTLRISPAGDLLSDRSVYETTLTPGAEWTSTQALNHADEAYGRNRSDGTASSDSGTSELDESLRQAIVAEYGAPAEYVIDLQLCLTKIVEERGIGVFVISPRELSRLIARHSHYPSVDPTSLLDRLTLHRRAHWTDLSSGLKESDIDVGRFDRPYSLINRPLLEVSDTGDRRLMVAPIIVSDSTMYSLSGLMAGSLQNQFWVSKEATRYAGKRAHAAGIKFEELVADKLKSLGLIAWTRCKLSWALNQKVDNMYGDIDVLAIGADGRRVWVIEAKNLQLCRTETEVAARLSEYRGQMIQDQKGRYKPDKMLRHIRRVQYLRSRNSALCGRLNLATTPEVRGLLIVDAPQPMNFYMLDQLEDGESVFLGALDSYNF